MRVPGGMWMICKVFRFIHVLSFFLKEVGRDICSNERFIFFNPLYLMAKYKLINMDPTLHQQSAPRSRSLTILAGPLCNSKEMDLS